MGKRRVHRSKSGRRECDSAKSPILSANNGQQDCKEKTARSPQKKTGRKTSYQPEVHLQRAQPPVAKPSKTTRLVVDHENGERNGTGTLPQPVTAGCDLGVGQWGGLGRRDANAWSRELQHRTLDELNILDPVGYGQKVTRAVTALLDSPHPRNQVSGARLANSWHKALTDRIRATTEATAAEAAVLAPAMGGATVTVREALEVVRSYSIPAQNTPTPAQHVEATEVADEDDD
jgi:hypothetical protein